MRHIAAHRLLTTANIDHARVGFTDGDRADRTAEKTVGDILPSVAAVAGAPNAAASRAEIIQERLAGHSGNRAGTAAAKWPNESILHRGEERGFRSSRGFVIGGQSRANDRGGAKARQPTRLRPHGCSPGT